MSKRLLKRFGKFTEPPLKFARWLAILLITLALAITIYCFCDSYPKDGRPMDIELPVIPTSLQHIYTTDPRCIKFDVITSDTSKLTFLDASIWEPIESNNILRIEVKKKQLLLNGKVSENTDSREKILQNLSS